MTSRIIIWPWWKSKDEMALLQKNNNKTGEGKEETKTRMGWTNCQN
jgi:hypothetical protein